MNNIHGVNLNFSSVSNVCHVDHKDVCNADQVMVYGWASCLYIEVGNTLGKDPKSPVKKVFDCALGECSASEEEKTTLEGRTMEQICASSTDSIGRVCKAGIAALMLENYKRKQENLPLIPLIFCYDIEGKKRIITPESIASRDPEANKIITNKELRRCYKICCELEKDPELKAIAEVAKESLKFVKLTGNESTEYKLELIHPFWESPKWETSWKERIATKQPADPSKVDLWREELKAAMASYNEKKSTNTSLVDSNNT
jgi:hypothetical protein